jgi:hypothetical protein
MFACESNWVAVMYSKSRVKPSLCERYKLFIALISFQFCNVYSAYADNLIANGTFSSGLTSWTQSGDTSYSGVESPVSCSNTVNCYRAGPSPTGYLTQNFTAASANLRLSFSLKVGTGTPNSFSAAVGANTLLSLTNSGSFNWSNYTYDFVGAVGSNTLTFSFYNPPDYWYLTNISVILLSTNISGLSVDVAQTTNTSTSTNTAANLNGAVTVNVANGAAAYLPNRKMTIVSSTGLSGTFSGVTTSQSLSFLTPNLSYDANNVYLAYSLTPFSTVAKNINERNVGNALTFAALGPVNGLSAPILNSLYYGNYQNAQAVMDTVGGSGVDFH